jgi:hypothetical protein
MAAVLIALSFIPAAFPSKKPAALPPNKTAATASSLTPTP